MAEQEVTFKNKHQELLKGYLHIPEKKYKYGIILSHCFTCSRHIKLMRKMCDYLAQDFIVLRFDFSGNGESEGKFEDATYTKEIADFQSAMNFLMRQGSGLKCIGALGHSMGSAVTILAGTKNKNVKALVTMGGDSSTQGIEHIFDKESLDCINKKGTCEITVFGRKVTMKRDFLEDAKRYSLSETLKKSKKPLCIIHGEQDEILPVDNARKLYFYANEPKSIGIIPKGNHMFTSPKAALPRSLEIARLWFKKYLK